MEEQHPEQDENDNLFGGVGVTLATNRSQISRSCEAKNKRLMGSRGLFLLQNIEAAPPQSPEDEEDKSVWTGSNCYMALVRPNRRIAVDMDMD